MTFQTILTQRVDDAIGLVTLNRPEAANALNLRMGEELASAVRQAENDSSIRVIVLTGSGKRAFCAGADLKERKDMTKEQWHTQHLAFEGALNAILHCKKPVIAAVNGAAIGGGMELAMACDFIYSSKLAKFGLTEASLGIMPGMGGTQTLPRAIGVRRAKELLFLARTFDADEAFGLGVVNRVCPPDNLLEDCIATALGISQNAPLSVAAIKHAMDEGIHEPLYQALRTELKHYNGLLDTNDRHEGINAFNARRKPRFSGS